MIILIDKSFSAVYLNGIADFSAANFQRFCMASVDKTLNGVNRAVLPLNTQRTAFTVFINKNIYINKNLPDQSLRLRTLEHLFENIITYFALKVKC